METMWTICPVCKKSIQITVEPSNTCPICHERLNVKKIEHNCYEIGKGTAPVEKQENLVDEWDYIC